MKNQKIKAENSIERLAEAFLSLNTVSECIAFFGDLFTVKEMEDISSRLEVARLLSTGENYIDIAAATGASTATISRVSKCLSGERGGYATVLERLYDSDKEDDDVSLEGLSGAELAAIKAVVDCIRAKKKR